MVALAEVATKFPLVARSRPPCAPLAQRVADLIDLASRADTGQDLTTAAIVCNQAALLASDCGMPDLARRWCQRQATIRLSEVPLSAANARHALEPLVNLARLHIRAGHGTSAVQLLDQLLAALTSRADVTIDGIHLPLSRLTATDADHQQSRHWLWAVTVAEGGRALASAGRWKEALAHHRHHGIGQRILDGRQVAILAAALGGNHHQALTLLADTEPGEQWETAVTTCLTALCRADAEIESEHHRNVAFDAYRQLQMPPGFGVFRARLALSLIDALGPTDQSKSRELAAALITDTLNAPDGYVVRDVLAHRGCTAVLTSAQASELHRLQHDAGLDQPEKLAPHIPMLAAAVEAVERLTIRLLKASMGSKVGMVR